MRVSVCLFGWSFQIPTLTSTSVTGWTHGWYHFDAKPFMTELKVTVKKQRSQLLLRCRSLRTLVHEAALHEATLKSSLKVWRSWCHEVVHWIHAPSTFQPFAPATVWKYPERTSWIKDAYTTFSYFFHTFLQSVLPSSSLCCWLSCWFPHLCLWGVSFLSPDGGCMVGCAKFRFHPDQWATRIRQAFVRKKAPR